jgi:hypothetical protein
MSFNERDFMRKEVNRRLKAGIKRPSKSPYSFPIIIVPKAGGGLRFVSDYRKSNALKILEHFQVNRILDVLDDMTGAVFFSQIDLTKSFWQIRLAEECKKYTAFTVPGMGPYEYKRLPFGNKNEPAIHNRIIASILGNLPFVKIYFDDITIFSKTFDEHMDHVRQVLEILREVNLKINSDKCVWAAKEIKLKVLGYILRTTRFKWISLRLSVLLNACHLQTSRNYKYFLAVLTIIDVLLINLPI